MKLAYTIALVTLSIPLGLSAQDIAPVPPTAGPPSEGKTDLDYAQKVFGISRSEAVERREATEALEAEIEKISNAFPDNLIGTFLEEQPTRVVLVFDGDVPAAELNKLATPKLSRFLKTKRSQFTKTELASFQDQLIALLPDSGGSAFIGYSHKNDRFNVEIEGIDAAQTFRQALPQTLRPITKVTEAATGSTQSTKRVGFADEPENYGSNQVAYSGFPLLNSGRFVCTLGFVSHDYNTQAAGVITGGHCPDNLSISYTNYDGSSRSLGAFDVKRYEPAGSISYDYKHYPATSIPYKRGYMWFDANTVGRFSHGCDYSGANCKEGSFANVDGALPSKGWLKVRYAQQAGGTPSYNLGHPEGAIRCKMGMTSGFSCGIIVEQSGYIELRMQQDDTTKTTLNGVVRVLAQDFMVATYYGDSGGPVFSRPTWNSGIGWCEVTAAGTMIGGTIKGDGTLNATRDRPCVMNLQSRYGTTQTFDTDCTFVYMPIDRVNDHKPSIAIKTLVGEQDSYVIP